MTAEEFARIRSLFDQAMELAPGQRRAFVDGHAPVGDPVHSQLLAMVEVGDDSAFLVNAFTAGLLETMAPADPNQPSQIGAYKILRVLGRGGMGVVYLALRNDDVFHKVVALKVIGAPAQSPDAGLVERFRQERQILAGLDHPNIARILDGGSTEDGRPFYAMEYVAGSPIDEYCARMQPDVPTRVRMMTQACDAIEYLHAHAITHRDVKPHNILVTLDGRVKLVDFGIAKVETAGGVLRSPSSSGRPTLIMTPGYASPEQLAGDASGKSGDIYSLAVVLYQLLTGRLPFVDSTGHLDLAAQLKGTPPDPPSRELTKGPRPAARTTEIRKLSYADLDRVVLTALQRDPLQRYATVQLFAEDLRRCLDGRPIVAHPKTVGYTARRLVSRHPVVAAVVALAAIATVASGRMVFDARMEQVALQAREDELERFVNVLKGKIDRWPEQTVAAAERVADVQAANRMLASDVVQTLSARAPDPVRVKRVIANLSGVLERADNVSRDQPPIRKEIALAFRRIGDFEKNARATQLTDKAGAALSYRRAAAIAVDIRGAETSWADQQLAELNGLLSGLGARRLDVVVPVEAVAETPQPPASAPPRSAVTVAAPVPAPATAVDQAALLELTRRLRTSAGDAERAHRNVELLRQSLAGQGQTLRTDVDSTMSEVDRLIEDAKSALEGNDLATAEDYLRRVQFQLRKVLQAVGG